MTDPWGAAGGEPDGAGERPRAYRSEPAGAGSYGAEPAGYGFTATGALYVPGAVPPGHPAPYPSGNPMGEPPRRGATTVQLLLVVVIVVLMAAGGALVWLWASGGDDSETASPASTTTVSVTEEPGTEETVTSTVQAAPGARLQEIALHDRGDLAGGLNNRWAAQLSAKQPGVFAEGRTWTEADILAEHEQLRSRFPQSRLVMSTQWPVFSLQGWWVTVMAGGFSSPDAANDWCRTNGFSPDHCFAKLISTSASSEGSTKYWKK
ncbi:hypothetical protein [Gordonia iterans]